MLSHKIVSVLLISLLMIPTAFAQKGEKVEEILTEIDPWVLTDTAKIMSFIDSTNQVTEDYIHSSKFWDPVVDELAFLLGIDYIASPQITNDGHIYFTMRITGDKAALFYMGEPMGWPVQVTPNS